nr:MAG TPA: hypothetical protein [Caudoviricetes sp.]
MFGDTWDIRFIVKSLRGAPVSPQAAFIICKWEYPAKAE